MSVNEDEHEGNTETITGVSNEPDMNGEDDKPNAKTAVDGDGDNAIDSESGAPSALDTDIGEEANVRCDSKSRHAELNTWSATAIGSERADPGVKPSAALLSIINDNTMDTWTKLKRMVEEDRGVLQWRVGGSVEYRDKGNERQRPRPMPPARPQLPQYKLGRQDGPQLGEPSRPSHTRLLQLLHPQWSTRKKE